VGLQELCQLYIPMFQSVSPPAGAETKFDAEQWALGNIIKTHFYCHWFIILCWEFLVSYNKLYGRFYTKLWSSFINNKN